MLLPDDSILRLLRARDLIHARYGEPLRIDDLAREAALSPFHFLRLFRAAFGETPHRYLTRVRIEAAMRLLLADAPVTDVCFDVGFQSLGSFSALFARRVGAAPSLADLEPELAGPYGIETVLQDDSGNWFSLVQRPR